MKRTALALFILVLPRVAMSIYNFDLYDECMDAGGAIIRETGRCGEPRWPVTRRLLPDWVAIPAWLAGLALALYAWRQTLREGSTDIPATANKL